MKRHVGEITLLATLMVSCVRAHALTAREILDHAKTLDDTARHWSDRTEQVDMAIHDARGGERHRVLKVLTKRQGNDERKSLTFVNTPAAMKGTVFLQWAHNNSDDDQWLYLPEFSKTRRIVAQLRDQSFLGTDFTYRDLDILGKVLEWTENDAAAALVNTEDIDGQTCDVIELRLRRTDTPYRRVVLWMDRQRVIVRRLEFFEEEGVLVKRLNITDFTDIGAVPTARHLEMQAVRNGSRTVITVTEVHYDTALSDELFSETKLESLSTQ